MLDAEVKEAKEGKEVKENTERVGPVKRYTDLLVYKQAYRLALAVSKFSKIFPKEETIRTGAPAKKMCEISAS